jgi:hypothetical protein
MHYCHQGKTDDMTPDALEARGLAQPAPYGTVGAWVLDKNPNGYLTLYAYSNEQGGLHHPLGGLDYFKPAALWDAARMAMDALDFKARESLAS